MNRVILALGGNIGDVANNFDLAMCAMEKAGIMIVGKSSIIVTKPVDCPEGSPDFHNMAILVETKMTPLELLEFNKDIECSLGRPKVHGVNQPRTIDIDIICYGNEVVDLENLKIPHPRALERAFVMDPIRELEQQKLFNRDEFKSLYEG